MITSTLSQLHWYKTIGPNFSKAIDYALTTDFTSMEPGSYPVEGDSIFAIVNEYTTKPLTECDPESHRDYTDIQIMITGIEKFGYTPLIDQEPTTPFDLENDLALYTMEEEELNYITLYPGQFIIFFPSDIHQPQGFHHQPSPAKKVVIKVAV